MYFGLSTRDVRKLANSTLSIRQPEATSLSRAMNFNPINVNMFMDKYESVLIKYKFEAHQVFNLDEIGITTVQNPGKIIAEKGKKQVGAITSAERGTLVTMCLAVNAVGNAIPPMFVFARVNYKDHFIRGGKPGCIGTSNKLGWMQGEQFLIFMQHFTKHVRCTPENKVLVLLDNHESHLCLPVIDYCREVETLETQSISLVTPENVRPYPKAKLNLKITQKGGRRKGKATILTDTPEKNEIAQRAAEKNKNIKRKLFPTEAKKRKGKLYSNSKSGEAWIQCCRCKFWSHEACAKIMFTAYYTCDNCEADDEK
ncbi:unnamed protein product [Macrosiphum euphorbiae]|uniref:DDE-1 domain-containing protein n=1 Tax=Macrosiphum euphorbiae TaxID=13131 RepID=A0AAV0WGW4_9HEMI|nr:unnamed protein product [Macrosiphum euphorbiae]